MYMTCTQNIENDLLPSKAQLNHVHSLYNPLISSLSHPSLYSHVPFSPYFFKRVSPSSFFCPVFFAEDLFPLLSLLCPFPLSSHSSFCVTSYLPSFLFLSFSPSVFTLSLSLLLTHPPLPLSVSLLPTLLT